MSVEILQYLSTGCFVLAGILLLAAGICFFAGRIPAIIGEMGKVAAGKAAGLIHRQNAVPKEPQGGHFRIRTAKLQMAPLRDIQGSPVPVIVEYEIGFWNSKEIIEQEECKD